MTEPAESTVRPISPASPSLSAPAPGLPQAGRGSLSGGFGAAAKERGRSRRNSFSPMKRSAYDRDPRVALHLHPGPLRRLLALAEGRRPVHRRPPRRGRLPDGGGARPPRQHVVEHRRALLAGARLRGLSGAAALRSRGVPPPARDVAAAAASAGAGRAAVLARPERVRDDARRRPRQRRGHRAQGLALGDRGRRRGDRHDAAPARRRHRPDGLLRVLPAPPADAAGPARGDRRQPVAGGARAPVADRRGDARHRPLRRSPAPARRARDEARAPPQGAHDGDHRRDAVGGRQARADPPLLLVQQPRLRALAHGAAEHGPGARLRRLRPRCRRLRRPHQGVQAEVRPRHAEGDGARVPAAWCAATSVGVSTAS